MKSITLLLVGFLMALPLAAQQKFSIESFDLDPFDTTAQNPEYEKIDGSGDRYAIIKVTSKEGKDGLKEYHFNFGYMNSFVESHGKALWVYVQKNSKRVTVSREGYETVEKYDLNTTIQSGKTYCMVLSAEAAVVRQQMVLFQIEPKDAVAVVMVTPEGGSEHLFGVQDETGGVAKSLPLGTYIYNVHSEKYNMSEGRFTLNDAAQVHQERVTLASNYSTISLQVASEADIYINGIRKGIKSWTGKLNPGTYLIECCQEHHRSSKQMVTIAENKDETIELEAPTPIMGTLAVTSKPLGADILIDGVKCGVTPMNVLDVLEGKHELTLQKKHYLQVKQSVEVVENQVQNVHLELNKGYQTMPLQEEGLWVDLGLSVLWATHNVGADLPEEYGDYFAWGEIEPKEEYTQQNSKFYGITKRDFSGNKKYDSATANWGAPARMPTKAEMQELIDNTTSQWTTSNGVKGCLVTSKRNGKSIFFPAAGYQRGTSINSAGEGGYYWSATPDKNIDYAYYLGFSSGFFDRYSYWHRLNGHAIRPVREK